MIELTVTLEIDAEPETPVEELVIGTRGLLTGHKVPDGHGDSKVLGTIMEVRLVGAAQI